MARASTLIQKNSKEFRSQENGRRMTRSEESSFIGTETNTRASYIKIFVMARELQHIKTDKSTKETINMTRGTGLESLLNIMGKNMMAGGTKIRDME